MNKKIFIGLIFLLLIMPNYISAKEIPISHNNCRYLVNVLNQTDIYPVKLSQPQFFRVSPNNQKHQYISVVNGGNTKNGLFIFEEDSNGKLYSVACTFNMNDNTMADNVTIAQLFFLNSIGVGEADINRLLSSVKANSNFSSGNNITAGKVWANSIGGYVAMIVQINEQTGDMLVGIVGNDSAN